MYLAAMMVVSREQMTTERSLVMQIGWAQFSSYVRNIHIIINIIISSSSGNNKNNSCSCSSCCYCCSI